MGQPLISSDSSALRLLVGVASLMIVIAGLRAAAPVLIPLALAAFLTITSLPLLLALRAYRVPSFVAIPLVLLLIISLLVGIGAIATNSLLEIREAMPRYIAQFGLLYDSVVAWLIEHRIIAPGAAEEILVTPPQIVDLATGLLRGAAGFMSLVFLVALITFFLLAEIAGVPRKLRAAMGREDADLTRYGGVLAQIQRYLAIKTATSLSTGILIGLWALFIGLDFPLFWGLTAFLLNFIPTIGSLIAAVPAVLLGLIQIGTGGAFLTAIGYLVVNTVVGSLIEPAVMGRGLGLSPFVVLISLLFWGWVWGPIGMLLSLPLTMVLKIVLENTHDLAWFAILMGPAGERRLRVLPGAPQRRASDPAPQPEAQ